MESSLITGLVAGLGIGTVATATVQHFLKKRESAFLSQRQDLEKRYRVVILLMYAAYDFEGNKSTMRIQRPDLTSQKDVLEELKAEWYNMLLFASETTQVKLHAFINNPELSNLKNAAVAMRSDLGRGKLGGALDGLEFKP